MGMRRTRSRFLGGIIAAVAAFAATLSDAPPAEASIVERIVAVVGDRPILLSELRNRARPHLYRIFQSTSDPTRQAAAESEMFRDLLSRMIDERLEEQAAAKANITVGSEEVDAGIRQVAAQAHIDVPTAIAEAKRQGGLSEQDYRDEIRRQVLEGKLIQLRVRNRVRVTDADAHNVYARWVKENAKKQTIDLRILALAIPPDADQKRVQERVALGEELSRRGKGGEDFCTLVKSYSDDPSTRDTCGSRGPLDIAQLSPELLGVVRALKPGEVSQPIMFRDPSGQAGILITQSPKEPLKVPTFDQVKDQMMDQAFFEATERQRKLWLQELRRGLYIDVRL